MTELNVTNLGDVLRGTRPGVIQTVGNMQIIPLLSDASFDEFAPLSGIGLDRAVGEEVESSLTYTTRSATYGTLVFKNLTERPLIVPRDAGFITKKAAQDHATPEVIIAQPGQQVEFPRAACIQRSQGGYIEEGDHRLIILPFPLREQNYNLRKKAVYDKLWPTITSMNRYMQAPGTGGHLEVFMNHYRKQLDQFVAEFEPVENQVGAIVIVNGKVAGIERVPSYQYWLDMWETIIRDCYGSLSLYLERSEPPETRTTLEGDFGDIQELYDAVVAAQQEEDEKARNVVRSLASEPLVIEDTNEVYGLAIQSFKSEQYVGQVVRQGARVIYASMTATMNRVTQPPGSVDAFTI